MNMPAWIRDNGDLVKPCPECQGGGEGYFVDNDGEPHHYACTICGGGGIVQVRPEPSMHWSELEDQYDNVIIFYRHDDGVWRSFDLPCPCCGTLGDEFFGEGYWRKCTCCDGTGGRYSRPDSERYDVVVPFGSSRIFRMKRTG